MITRSSIIDLRYQMARGFRIEVKGADRLIKALQKAGDQVAKEVEAELR